MWRESAWLLWWKLMLWMVLWKLAVVLLIGRERRWRVDLEIGEVVLVLVVAAVLGKFPRQRRQRRLLREEALRRREVFGMVRCFVDRKNRGLGAGNRLCLPLRSCVHRLRSGGGVGRLFRWMTVVAYYPCDLGLELETRQVGLPHR